MFTTEDQREEMLALKAKKPAANTATTVFSAPQVINPVGLNVGFRLENSALEAEEKSKLYADCSTIFAEKANQEEKWGSPEESRYFREQSIEMGMASREYGAKAQFFRELSYNPGLLYASPKGAPKPLTKAPSPMFKSAGTTAAQPSGGFGNAQNTKITPISPLTTPQTASARERRPAVPATPSSTTDATKPSRDYEVATTSAQNAYKAYTEANRAFKEKYSWRREPERCIGYYSSKKELDSLQETCTESAGEMIGYFLEESERLAGTMKGWHIVDRWNAERKAMAVWDYMEAMVATNKTPDPAQLKKLIDEALAAKRQPSTSPAIEYAKKTINQMFAGGTTDDVTALGTGLLLAGGASGLDWPLDALSLGYDVAHINEIPKGQFALDALALLPVAGLLKHGDDAAKLADDAVDGIKNAYKADIGTDMAKIAGRTISPEEAELLAALEEAGGKPRKNGIFQQILDPDWYKKYNELITDYDNAAMKNAAENGGEYVTYYRVQNPDGGSKELIKVNADGSITIDVEKFPNQNLSVSAYNDDHAKYFAQKQNRSNEPYVVAFDVPVWFDELIRKNALPQTGYRTNPLNKGRTAPKMTDTTTVGYKYEFPPIWNEFFEKYAINARKLDIGELP